MNRILLCLIFILVWPSSQAAKSNQINMVNFDKYSVHYTVFNSTFLQEDIAALHKLKRSKYESLINVSVVNRGDDFGGLPVEISGTVTNLMQQQKRLDFIAIQEQDIVYYIAPVRVNGEETVHFHIEIIPENSDKPLTVKFTKKIYSD